jgi:hypothetical protein
MKYTHLVFFTQSTLQVEDKVVHVTLVIRLARFEIFRTLASLTRVETAHVLQLVQKTTILN